MGRPLASAGKVDQPRADVAQRDAPLVDLAHAELHAVDDLAQLGFQLGQLLGVLAAAVRFAPALELTLDLGNPVAIGLQLLQQRPQLRELLIRLVDPEIARHGSILALG